MDGSLPFTAEYTEWRLDMDGGGMGGDLKVVKEGCDGERLKIWL